MANGDAGDLHAYNSAQRRVAKWLHQFLSQGFISAKPISAGRVDNKMKTFAKANGIAVSSTHLYITPRSVAHSQRDFKRQKQLTVSAKSLLDFVRSRSKYDLYWDGEGFIYTDYKDKFIVHPNYELKIRGKKSRKVNFITAGVVERPDEFDNPKYQKV